MISLVIEAMARSMALGLGGRPAQITFNVKFELSQQPTPAYGTTNFEEP